MWDVHPCPMLRIDRHEAAIASVSTDQFTIKHHITQVRRFERDLRDEFVVVEFWFSVLCDVLVKQWWWFAALVEI